MAETRGRREDIELLLRVARLYYEENRTQSEVAREVGYSRPHVSRLLSLARERGIVRITISHPLEHVIAVEHDLREGLPVEAVRVAQVPGSDTLGAIGAAAAELLRDVLVDGQVLALGNGRSIAAMAHHLPELIRPGCTVVQLLGSIPGGLPAWGRDSPTICNLVAERLGAKVSRMSVPLIVDDPALLEPLMREERVATTLALGARADIAAVGVAGIDARGPGNILAEYLTPDVVDAIEAGGAVGHILDHHYDWDGNQVVTPLTRRTLSLPFEDLKRIERVIGVAAGPEKVEAIIAAVRGGVISTLVTDYETAVAIRDRV
ncbi:MULTISPECIES: sugar-binding transcriptional regulator [unclassified Actinomyces]|uniref:sugar-binding transcriptional regulator n=1 Tax=unclassified Actinomyces TaxID=2609248 RepID=UPI00201730BB|nr:MULTISPECIES: sugar-binding transcriptional regulator [unclassified Actinomyces]MCL3777193.1 sugar-binding transcriptional regulator [Actinomyces sp. AC-20-1]MCL3788983.1 sugar-binding transcriptional regulator [Actinomyces sp. 187325]MCL3791338.1 sugar-binding transcriptional regulator [Actinomyces sp. 186855]MCL3793951.1 sugar-binding transcriptional regulator [Actinomyces sp. 217892]